jgi:hypothetical protein
MQYMVTLYAEEAIRTIRDAMPLSVRRMMDEAAQQEHEVSFGFDSEEEASKFTRSFFPELVASMPLYALSREQEEVVRLWVYRDIDQLHRSAALNNGGGSVAKIEAHATNPVEAANIVMRTIVAYDFNLWMPEERAAEVAATVRRLMPPGPSS